MVQLVVDGLILSQLHSGKHFLLTLMSAMSWLLIKNASTTPSLVLYSGHYESREC